MSGAQGAVPIPNPALRVLVVEDDASHGELLRYQLKQEGYERSSSTAAKRRAEGQRDRSRRDAAGRDAAGQDGREVLQEVHTTHPEIPVVMMTAAGSVEMAVECMKRGAVDFLAKPFDIERLYSVLRNAIQIKELKARVNALEGALIQKHAFDNIVARAPVMRQVVEHARRASLSDSDVLVLGESGSGKEVFARAISEQFGAPQRPVRRHQLRRDPRGPAGKRTLRARKGRVHRRVQPAHRLLRTSRRRHAVPRRDRRDAPGHAGAPAARAGTARDPARRRRPHHQGQRA
ncbi:MAG: sigma-54-dependent Fis family transcriptional regulator [Planctomycetota bacterium]|nr:sigma-54-dependent Fis family transcriptional regulator [Planctomycetota bacterium]